MNGLIVPLHLMRNAIEQSHRLGMDESRAAVIERVLNDLRTTDHPAVAAVRAQAEFFHYPPRSPR